ncbi:MAG: MFS transporter [Chloroflexi bacterium]|nr:MFS transporter [Chloroflexota bacterium]
MFAEYGHLLRHNANYRYLWYGYVVSQLGDWFNLIASAALITRVTSAGTALSYLFLARFLPQFVFSPFAGMLSDQYDRRKVMIVSDILRAITVLGFLLVREPSQIWLFYLLTILQFVLSALFVPARSAVLANIVSRKELVAANALDSVTWSTMLAVGAMLGGVATAVFGIETAFILDALTFILSAWLIARIKLPVDLNAPVVERGYGWLEMIGGVQYLRLEPILFGVVLAKAGGALVWGAINVLEVNYAKQIFPLPIFPSVEGDVLTLAIIYALSGVGTGLGPILVRHWLGDMTPQMLWGIALGFGLLAAGILALAVAPTLSLFLVATLFRTVGSGVLWVFSAALLQSVVPDKVRGRVFAFEFALLTLTQSISIYWAGAAQDWLGWDVRLVTLSMGGLGTAVALLWLIFVWQVRHKPFVRYG